MTTTSASPPAFTPAQLATLRHMLGINDPYRRYPTPTRNYYCANPGDPEIQELQRLGAVELTHANLGYEFYKTTDVGSAAARASFKTIQKKYPARVYRAFLRARDYDCDLTFRKFLTSADYAMTRYAA